jgi:hypothetical protein
MLRQFAVITALTVFSFGQVLGRQPSAQEIPKQEPSASTARKSDTFGETLRKSVGFLTVDFTKDGRPMQISGTCFFVFYEDKRLGESRGFRYLITNRHMAAPGTQDGMSYPVSRTSIRLNLRTPNGSTESEQELVPLGRGMNWVFPNDSAVDLAVLPTAPDTSKYEYADIPASLIATKDVVDSQKISEGDSVIFSGYFVQFAGQRKIQPIVRQGIVSMMPDEEIDTTLRKPGHLYLAEVHAYGGNSGSPVFVNVGGLRNGMVFGNHYLLLGVVSGYVFEDSNLKLTVATTLEGQVHGNSGISTVVPAYELKNLLDSPLLRELRDGFVEYENTKR